MRRKVRRSPTHHPLPCFVFFLFHFPHAPSNFESSLLLFINFKVFHQYLWSLKHHKQASESVCSLQAERRNSSTKQHISPHCLFSYGLTSSAASTQRSDSVSDRDAGLISTDAKDLKVSLRISQRSQTTAEEPRETERGQKRERRRDAKDGVGGDGR